MSSDEQDRARRIRRMAGGLPEATGGACSGTAGVCAVPVPAESRANDGIGMFYDSLYRDRVSTGSLLGRN